MLSEAAETPTSGGRASAPNPAPSSTPQAIGNRQPDWNIFPDPTTGRIEVYRNGTYIGSITGDEIDDPPMPHALEEDPPHH